ncbi:MAG: 50S ribosomal protein L24 [Candidatus Moranbacteria bacterium]|nr:50S ribosomal protein L24 [Candidatus Moranbacteria bacterium]
MKIKKQDNVIIISGKDKGFKGKVIEAHPKDQQVVIDGANLIKKHIKSQKKGEKGQRIELPAPIHVSNVAFFCQKCKKGSRIGFDIKDGSKKRICKKCSNEI